MVKFRELQDEIYELFQRKTVIMETRSREWVDRYHDSHKGEGGAAQKFYTSKSANYHMQKMKQMWWMSPQDMMDLNSYSLMMLMLLDEEAQHLSQ